MRESIRGTVYDTDNAILLGTHSDESEDHGFCWCNEGLYKSADGYFLAGSGGPGSRYAHRAEGVVSRGSGVVPVSLKTAKKWAEEFLSPKERREAFNI